MTQALTRTGAALAAAVVLALVVAILGFGGGRYWRQHTTEPASAPATVTVVRTATPAVVAHATLAPPPPPVALSAVPARPAAVTEAIAAALRAGALGPSVHALVADAATGATLYRRGAAGSVAPASTAKLLTGAAALAAVGAQTTIETKVVTGAKAGEVVLVGGGDPTLSAAAPGTPSLYRGAARLSDLAARAKRAVAAPIRSIVVDTSVFTGADEAPGWADDDVPSTYASAINALVVDGGRPAQGGDERSEQPALEAGRAFAALLGHPDLPVSAGDAPARSRTLARVQSPPVLDLVEQMLSDSDNVIAEMLARQVARVEHKPLSFAGSVVAVRSALAAVGVRVPATMVDGSGLSTRDRLTPASLVAVLRAALSAKHPGLAQLITALPVAGWEGTLAKRYGSSSSDVAAGRVRAKTGTLSGVVTLAGVVPDRSGRLLVFAVMTDDVPADGPEPAEAALDDAIAKLAACTCR